MRSLLGGVLLTLAACSGTAVPPGTVVAVPAAPTTAPAPDYRIGALDELRIDVLQEPDLSFKELPVSPDGTIVIPGIGVIAAAGHTAPELAAVIAGRLGSILRNPRVSVNVTEYVSQQVSVLGAVGKPGRFPVPGQVRLSDAVALAEGTTEYAKLREVVVLRDLNGQRQAAHFDLQAIQAGQAPDPVVRSGDTVIVGYSAARRLFRDVVSILPFAAGVFVTVAR